MAQATNDPLRDPKVVAMSPSQTQPAPSVQTPQTSDGWQKYAIAEARGATPQSEAERVAELRSRDYSWSVVGTLPKDRPRVVASHGDMPFAYSGELTVIHALAGVGKSAFLALMFPPETRLLWVDTEQTGYSLRQTMDRLAHQRGAGDFEHMDNVRLVSTLKEAPNNEAVDPSELIEWHILTCHPEAVVIDNLRDITPTDERDDEARQLATDLIGLAERYNVAFVAIVHSARSTGDIKGHLGTVALEKSCVAIKLERPGGSPTVNVSYSKHRLGRYDLRCAFSFSETGDPEWATPGAVSATPSVAWETAEYWRDLFRRSGSSTLTTGQYMTLASVTRNTASNHLGKGVDSGALTSVGTSRRKTWRLASEGNPQPRDPETSDEAPF